MPLNQKSEFIMGERLVIVSDMWGAKKGLWITSYLGYLQQYFDMTYYDCQQLGDLDVLVQTTENVEQAFLNGGVDTAVNQLLLRERKTANYLAFGTGATIVWKAAVKGLSVSSIYAISPEAIGNEEMKPAVPVTLVYGSLDRNRPGADWCAGQNLYPEIIEHFGNTLYTDEKIIKKVSADLLRTFTMAAIREEVV